MNSKLLSVFAIVNIFSNNVVMVKFPGPSELESLFCDLGLQDFGSSSGIISKLANKVLDPNAVCFELEQSIAVFNEARRDSAQAGLMFKRRTEILRALFAEQPGVLEYVRNGLRLNI